MATHNRREVVASTLTRLAECGLDREAFEIIVVDNASTDGTREAIGDRCDVLIRLRKNAGSCAKADGVARANGQYIVFLDDDSCPRPGSVARMMSHFEEDAGLGAAGFAVHLPDGRREGGALPDVFVGCGVGFRAQALLSAGGLDRSFFMQAEEYDLTFRLATAGWRVRMFDDLHVDHLKTRQTRKSGRTTFFDVRNNLRVAARYLPAPYHHRYRDDWLQRYAWLAQHDGHVGPYVRGALSGLTRGWHERLAYAHRRLRPDSFEQFFRWGCLRRRMGELAAAGVRSIVLADLGKNVLAYHQAAGATGVKVLAVGDDRFCGNNRRYRGTPVLPLADALDHAPDAIVIGNTSAVHGSTAYHRVVELGFQPVYHWFGSVGQSTDKQDVIARATRVPDEPAMVGAQTSS
jgi:GT2 family glycosyltransferase